MRYLWALTMLAALMALPATAQDISTSAGGNFDALLAELWPQAKAQGITRATFDAAFARLTPDPRVVAATRKQPEYGKPIGDYVNTIASKTHIEVGARKASQWTKTLDIVEQRFAVERWVVLGIWGIETAYGQAKDTWDIVRSLATLVQAHYREAYFRKELLIALKLMQEGHIRRENMLGSWAGAMGQTQFMPSDYLEYAVAISGHGQGDIWTSVPDVLASIANYLHKEGWKQGVPWGFEIIVPHEFDYTRSRASFPEWAKLGIQRNDNRAFPSSGEAILFFPSGASGPAFLVTENFTAIKRYNNSDVYALAVAHLADRVRGDGPIRKSWPPDDRQLSRDQRIGLQRKLAALGYGVHDFEGHIDFDLRDAIRTVQVQLGMLPDGHPTMALLDRLGVTAR